MIEIHGAFYNIQQIRKVELAYNDILYITFVDGEEESILNFTKAEFKKLIAEMEKK